MAWLSLREAAELLGYHSRFLHDKRARQRLGLEAFVIEPTGALRVRREDVLRLVVPADQPRPKAP
jgi:hypothetical protein